MVSLNKSESNELKIPLFQRDYVWNTKDETIPNLLYSLKKGFPIGNLTLWSKQVKVDKVEIILIDGLQRTFSIINIISEPWKYISHKLHQEEYKKIVSSDEEVVEIEDKIISMMQKQNNKLKTLSSFKEVNKYLTKNKDDFSLEALKNIIDWVKNDLKNLKIIINYINNASHEQVTEIFNLMNSNGKKLNKFEALSSHWSLTPIFQQNLEYDIIKLIENRDKKYCLTLSKLENKNERNNYISICEKSLREKSDNIIPSDYLISFIHFIFQNNNFNSKLKKVYISGEKLINNEMSTYILMNLLEKRGNSDKWDFESFGERLSKIVNKESDFATNAKKKLTKVFKIIEEKFELMEFMDSFSKENESKTLLNTLHISGHFITSLINQIFSYEEEASKIEKCTIQLKLLETKIYNDYSFSSSPDKSSINAYNDKFLITNYKNEAKEKLLYRLKEKIFPEDKIKNSFSNIDKIITLYTHSIDASAKKGNIHFDHIFPKSIIKKLKIKDNELINLINSYANSQVLSEGKNIQKGNGFFPEELQYDTLRDDKNFNNLLSTNYIGENGYKDLISDLKEIKKNEWKLRENDDLEELQKRIKNILNIRLEIINKKIKEKVFLIK